MPLRSKITNATFSTTKPNAISNDARELSQALPGDEQDDVLFTSNHGLRVIELNRPKKLNSLNGSMARKLIGRLKEYEKSELLTAILIKGAGRAFCAGGDVAALALDNKKGTDGQQRSKDYFALEYKLDHLIATYTKPYIAFIDGITMGGGVGLSVHAPIRIATENTVFAMPETTIGFFPEVGASFFLPRMDGGLGKYLALTSAQLKGVDVFYHGIATHYLHSSSLPALEQRLGELIFKDFAPMHERLAIINDTVEEFASGLPADRPQLTGQLRIAVDKVFHNEAIQSPTDIITRLQELETDPSNAEIQAWASKIVATIRERSPTSVAVTLRQMQVARSWNIAQAFQHEHNIASKFMSHPDFVEGVTARLIERKKGRPDWQPNALDDVKNSDVDSFFKASPQLSLLSSGPGSDYAEYPYGPNSLSGHHFGLPSEEQIIKFKVRTGRGLQTTEIAKHFIDLHHGKQGVKEKVYEVLERA